MEKNPLEELANKYRHLTLLERKYMVDDLNRLENHKNIVKLLEEIKIEIAKFNEGFDEEYKSWKDRSIANREYIEVMDTEKLLNILCTTVNIINPNYSIKKLHIAESVNSKDASEILKFGVISILSDNETLARFNAENKVYYYNSLINELNKLFNAGKSFIMSNNLIAENDNEIFKEKIASRDQKDLIILVNPGDPLDECINKFVMYATKYGSDFNEKKVNAVANLINYQPVKTRKLTNNKYIKYYDNNNEE